MFQVKTFLEKNLYVVQSYNEPESVIQKYKCTDLYLLPPDMFSHEPVDTMDIPFFQLFTSTLIFTITLIKK